MIMLLLRLRVFFMKKKIKRIGKRLHRCDRRIAKVTTRLSVFSSLMLNSGQHTDFNMSEVANLGGELDDLVLCLRSVTQDVGKIHDTIKSFHPEGGTPSFKT